MCLVAIELKPFEGSRRLKTNFWVSPANQFQFFQHLKLQSGNTYDSLYSITVHHIFRSNGTQH